MNKAMPDRITIHAVYGEDEFLPYMCDVHTHGLKEICGKEFQFTLRFSKELVSCIFDAVIGQVLEGKQFKDGDYVTGVFEGDVKLRINEVKNDHGHSIMRIIAPDEDLRWPEDSDAYPFNMQLLDPYKSQKEH